MSGALLLLYPLACLLAFGRVGKERAHRRLAIARRPNLIGGVERACHAAHIDTGNALGLLLP